jgi:hypothetical protein
VQERFKPDNPKSLVLRTHCQTSGYRYRNRYYTSKRYTLERYTEQQHTCALMLRDGVMPVFLQQSRVHSVALLTKTHIYNYRYSSERHLLLVVVVLLLAAVLAALACVPSALLRAADAAAASHASLAFTLAAAAAVLAVPLRIVTHVYGYLSSAQPRCLPQL